MSRIVRTSALLAGLCGVIIAPAASDSQGVDVFLNVMAGGAKKLNIALPTFTLVGGSDPDKLASKLPEIIGRDLTFSALFSVVAGTDPLPADDPATVKKAWSDFASAGAHAALHGFLRVRGQVVETEVRLYDLTSPDQHRITSFVRAAAVKDHRRLAHKIADEVVHQFTGEPGIADTKIAYAGSVGTSKEIFVMDSDAAAPFRLTHTDSINLSAVWHPDARSLAFTSYMWGYPYLFRLFVFEKRPIQTLASFTGINSSPAWSPDGKSVALTLTKDGNPEIYVLNVATGTLRRLTNHWGIDTEPTWAPTGREIAFVSDRAGTPRIFLMDAEGANVRRLTPSGFNTQPRWSPKGDVIVYTSRQGNHDVWAINVDGSNPRRLTAGPGSNESASWAPNGRHLVFQSNRLGGWRLFTMLADGSEQQPLTRGPGESTSPSWSPRLPW
ncbi:MAG: Tol-Pal system beta propeller repeat protein TolB [Candidatus Rokubacteria bacterium]|nr:Tol-Pal system beta propeller repeat protein TolB [Candidatus Rokubacteria bacterium]